MSGIALIADVHVGNHRPHGGPIIRGMNTRCREIIDVLRRACTTARAREAEALIVLGDLFDTTRPTPQMVAAVRDTLLRGPDKTYLLLGNHEMVSETPGDHALAPLAGTYVVGTHHQIKTIEVIDSPRVTTIAGWDVMFVPHRRRDPEEWVASVLDELQQGFTGPPRMLAIHAGIRTFMRDMRDPAWAVGKGLDANLLRRLMGQYDIRLCAAGDWHWGKLIRWAPTPDITCSILQCGALVPVGWKDANYDSVPVYIADLAISGHLRSCQHGPAPGFLTVDSYERCAYLASEPSHAWKPLRIRWTVGPDDFETSLQAAEELCVGRPNLSVDVVVSSDTLDARADTHAVQLDVSEALRAHVGGSTLPRGVCAADVVARVEEYLA